MPEHVHYKRMKLNQHCRHNIKYADAAGTRANHRTHYAAYLRFCKEYMFRPFPADEWRYCQFAQFLSAEHKEFGTIQNYCSSVRTLHRLQGLPVPETDQIHYSKTIQCFKKARKTPVKQATPMTHETLLQLFQHVNLTQELEAVAWVAVLVGFCLILRVSNLGPVSRNKFDPDKNFVRGDLQYKQGFYTLSVHWSKTIQYKNKVLEAPLVPAKNKAICPQHWVTKMIKLIPAHEAEPLFLVRSRKGRSALTSNQVRRLLKKWCQAAGLDHQKLTPRCLRRGGLNWGHQAKLTGEALKLLGDWGSMAYLRYIDQDFEARLKTGKQMAKIMDDMF